MMSVVLGPLHPILARVSLLSELSNLVLWVLLTQPAYNLAPSQRALISLSLPLPPTTASRAHVLDKHSRSSLFLFNQSFGKSFSRPIPTGVSACELTTPLCAPLLPRLAHRDFFAPFALHLSPLSSSPSTPNLCQLSFPSYTFILPHTRCSLVFPSSRPSHSSLRPRSSLKKPLLASSLPTSLVVSQRPCPSLPSEVVPSPSSLTSRIAPSRTNS